MTEGKEKNAVVEGATVGISPQASGDYPVIKPEILTELAVSNVEKKTQWWWKIGFFVSFLMLIVGIVCIRLILIKGVGVWGLNYPVAWAWDITNFVFWIGIAHAGTLISAILFLLHQRWRTSVNRVAEAMTLFAVICAFIYPVIHTGRPWYAWWLLPIPVNSGVWPQYRSPLTWDVFAIITYLTVSTLFFYIGMLPDLAIVRNRAKSKLKWIIYHFLCLGWSGSSEQWRRYQTTYLLLAALLTPLVISVHSIVSCDFALSLLPGWHSTLLPPYFVAGAIFSGIAMVLTLIIPLRYFLRLESFINEKIIDPLCKIALATSWFLIYCYVVEVIGVTYKRDYYELTELLNRITGQYSWAFILVIIGNVIVPQLFWFKKYRTSFTVVFVISILINIGMWSERFLLIASSLSTGFIQSTSGSFKPTHIDLLTFVGTFGLFLTLLLLLFKYVPVIALSEFKHTFSLLFLTQNNTTPSNQRISNLPLDKSKPDYPHFLLAGFNSVDNILTVLKKLKKNKYEKISIYLPFPVKDLENILPERKTFTRLFALIGGILGFALGLFIVWYQNKINYPVVIAGKPMFNFFLAFPVAFECSILLSAIGSVLGMFIPNNLPKLSDPVFKSLIFKIQKSSENFYLLLDSEDEQYNFESVRDMLESNGADFLEIIKK